MKPIKDCKECGVEKTLWCKNSKALHGGYFRCASCHVQRTRDYREQHTVSRLWSSCKSRARRLGIEFTITQDDIVIPTICPILGIPLDPSYTKRSEGTPSIDRVDNTKGYTKDNVVVTSWRANRLKNNGSIAELAAIVSFYQLVPTRQL